jgi:hypothetical protein
MFPAARLAMLMKHSDHNGLIGASNEVAGIGKPMEEGTPHILAHRGKLVRQSANSVDGSRELEREGRPELGIFSGVPTARAGHVRFGIAPNDDGDHFLPRGT